jgi:hypothetical protein
LVRKLAPQQDIWFPMRMRKHMSFCSASTVRPAGAAGRSTCIARTSSVLHRGVPQFGASYPAHIEKQASMNGLELSLQVEVQRTAKHFWNVLEAPRFPRSISDAIPEIPPQSNSEHSWCRRVPERRLSDRHDRCCTTTNVAVTSTCRVKSIPDVPRHNS